MGDGACQAAHRSQLLARVQARLELLLLRDITHNLGYADDLSRLVSDWRDRQRDMNPLSVLSQPHRLEMLDSFSGPDLFENLALLIVQLGRDNEEDRATHDFLGAVTEDVFGGRVQTGHYSVQVFADSAV